MDWVFQSDPRRSAHHDGGTRISSRRPMTSVRTAARWLLERSPSWTGQGRAEEVHGAGRASRAVGCCFGGSVRLVVPRKRRYGLALPLGRRPLLAISLGGFFVFRHAPRCSSAFMWLWVWASGLSSFILFYLREKRTNEKATKGVCLKYHISHFNPSDGHHHWSVSLPSWTTLNSTALRLYFPNNCFGTFYAGLFVRSFNHWPSTSFFVMTDPSFTFSLEWNTKIPTVYYLIPCWSP
jgi:hypothetical protein